MSKPRRVVGQKVWYRKDVRVQDYRDWERINHVQDQDYADVVFWDKMYSDDTVFGKEHSFDWYITAERGMSLLEVEEGQDGFSSPCFSCRDYRSNDATV